MDTADLLRDFGPIPTMLESEHDEQQVAGGDGDMMLFDSMLQYCETDDFEPMLFNGLAKEEFSSFDSNPGRRLTFEQVFDLLIAAESGRFANSIPIRPQASPINVGAKLFFVVASTFSLQTEEERQAQLGDPNSLIGVKYQSFSNGEVWWSEKHDFTIGIVARNMSRKVRSYKPGPAQSHGFTGRWYTLLRRPTRSTTVTRSNCRSFVVVDSPSLVQFWSADAPARKRKRTCSRDDVSRVPVSPEVSTSSHADMTDDADSIKSNGEKNMIQCVKEREGEDGVVIIRGSLRVEGDAIYTGDLSVKNLHVQGTLTVEGGINGQLVTPPEAADYAEWFAKLDPSEKIEAGDVVQLRSPEQKVTLNTSGNGPIMVVSTKPSVAAGVPFGEAEHQGVLCGFLGQVPVKVIGPVNEGDLLVPSGLSNGYAVAGRVFHANKYEPLGTAMEKCEPGKHIILSFVRWAHNTKWDKLRQKDKSHYYSVKSIWQGTRIAVIINVILFCAIITGLFQPTFDMYYLKLSFLLDMALVIWAILHYPNYIEFVYEVYLYYLVGVFKLGAVIYALQTTLGLDASESEWERALSKREIAYLIRDVVFLGFEIFEVLSSFRIYRDTTNSLMEMLHASGKANGSSDMPSPWYFSNKDLLLSDWNVRKNAVRQFIFGLDKRSKKAC